MCLKLGNNKRIHTVAVADHIDSVDRSINEAVIGIAFCTSSHRVAAVIYHATLAVHRTRCT